MEIIFEHSDGLQIYQPTRRQLNLWIDTFSKKTIQHIEAGEADEASITTGMVFSYAREIEYREMIDAGIECEQPYE